MSRGIAFGVHVDDVVLRAGAGGPEFLPVDDPVVTLAPRRSADGSDVGSGIGLRDRDGHLDLARKQLRKPEPFLFLGALANNVQAAEDASAVGHYQVDAGARQLLGD